MPTFVDPNACVFSWFCPVCAGVAYEGLCGHQEKKQDLSGTLMRSIIQGGTEPNPLTLRAEVFEVVQKCSQRYGFGSPFVDETYLEKRTPVMSMANYAMPLQDCTDCTCNDQH